MSRQISVPRVDSETSERVAVSPHVAEQKRRVREQELAARRVRRVLTDPDALAEVMQMLGLDGTAKTYLTGPVSPDSAMSSRSVRPQ
jgi:hypothetical protein